MKRIENTDKIEKKNPMEEKIEKTIIPLASFAPIAHVALKIAKQMPRGREETVSGRSGN